ncbi:hypothetical protein RD792_014669 [Penstemon davidsonii]|uniref:High-affinity nitrate transporter n=1 Tax=Penstemon davidsonii TaxID=160366 RepID=A0ABR0CRI5_9LAMI|nr:hypothetical protein RD792_014669 [Penstemon davidsonii]
MTPASIFFNTLIVIASPQPGQAGIDLAYKTIKVKLCYAPISQKDREWRKTEDDLAKDKTCQHEIVARPCRPSNNTFTWTIKKDIPTATYFIRAYAYNSADEDVAFGQTTDYHKTTSLLEVHAVSGCTVPLDIASICLSVFAIASLFGFYLLVKKRARASLNRVT